MTDSESEQEVEMHTLEVDIPDKDRFEDRVEGTRFSSTDDFVVQILDEAAVLARYMDDIDRDDTIEIEIPQGVIDETEDLIEHKEQSFDSLEDVLSFLITQLTVHERTQYGGI